MTTTTPRALISAMQVTLDGYILGPEGEADWVDSWADGLELLPPVDAFVLGGGMFPDYEQFWTAILDDPGGRRHARQGLPTLARSPTPASPPRPRIWCSPRRSPTRRWPTARIVRDIDEIRDWRQQPGKAVYVVGGPGLVTSLINAGLLDELRLIVHPVAAGGGTALFGGIAERQAFELVSAEPMASGRVHLTYRLGAQRGSGAVMRRRLGHRRHQRLQRQDHRGVPGERGAASAGRWQARR